MWEANWRRRRSGVGGKVESEAKWSRRRSRVGDVAKFHTRNSF